MITLKTEIPLLDDIKMRLERIEERLDSIKIQKSQHINSWLTSKEAAKVLGVTTRTLQTYRDMGMIPFSQFGREVRFKAEDLQEFLMLHYVRSNYRKEGVS